MDSARLEALVAEGLSVRQIASALGVSATTVRRRLEKARLRTAPSLARASARGTARRTKRTCRRHGVVDFVLEGRGYYRCTRCRMERVVARRRQVKQLLVEEAGGRCALCGYDRYVGALHFHHVDPATKRFGVASLGATRGLALLREEAKKCLLLCANCHAEVDGGARVLQVERPGPDRQEQLRGWDSNPQPSP